ncbi:hypothetical protein M0812_00738 [Anaeramoeba flamelloides]|uniref:Uncharacterized protein n=1 Tax=Anaeramoeba flamelloides TaxID=1746091 RepID=A0AAV8A210_9EUKA|nr:hypothetical protein M0812_00738 [Anaeramoeba flamelloides]
MNPKDQKSSPKTIGIFNYNANTLRSLELIFTKEELENHEFIFYVPKSAFNRTKIFQKRWVWYSPPNFYSSQSDILAILVHFGSFKFDQKSLQLFGLLAGFRWTQYVPQYYDMKRKNGIRSRQSQNPEGKCVYVKRVTLDVNGSLKPTYFKNGKDSEPNKSNPKTPQKMDSCLPLEDENDLILNQKPRTLSLVEKINNQNHPMKNPNLAIEDNDTSNSLSTRENEKKRHVRNDPYLHYQPIETSQKTSFNLFFPKKKNFDQAVSLNAQLQSQFHVQFNYFQSDNFKFTYLPQNNIKKIRPLSHKRTSIVPNRTNLKSNNTNLFTLNIKNSDFLNLPFIDSNETKFQKHLELLPTSNDNQNLQSFKNNRKNLLFNKKTLRKSSKQKVKVHTIKHNSLECFHSRVFSFSNDPWYDFVFFFFFAFYSFYFFFLCFLLDNLIKVSCTPDIFMVFIN